MAQNDSWKRAASMLTIAQHKFKQALKKEDIDVRLPPVAIELSSQFLSDLQAVLKQDTPANVQKCTVWIVKHIAPSRTRVASLGDYMASLSKSIVLDEPTAAAAAKAVARSRLAPLLVINDVLHTDKFHSRSAAKSGVFSKEIVSCLPDLIDSVTACAFQPGSQAEKKLRALLNYWAVNQVLSVDEIKSLRDRADEAFLVAQGGAPVRKRNYLLPEYHGDRQAQWHDLPASYMLDQMIKQPHRPIDLRRVKPTRFDKKPVTPHVRKLLDNFFDNIDLKYVPTGDNPTGETKKYKLWLDPMGQLVKQDKDSGETNTVHNGYGWSAKLCQDVQKDGVPETIRLAREEALREAEMESARPPPQQRTSDRRYQSPPRRRMSSSSMSDSDYRRSRGRRSRSHSRASSRSSYDSRRGHRQDSRSNDRARSRSRRDTSPRRERQSSRDRDRHYNEDRGHQQRPPPRPYGKDSSGSGQQVHRQDPPRHNLSDNAQYPPPPPPQNAQGSQQPPPPPPPFSGVPFQSHPAIPNQFPGQFPMQSFPPPPPFQQGAFPGGIPPPPPPNYSGPFPPPPPNMTAMPNAQYNFGGNQTSPGNNGGYGQNPGHAYGQGNFRGGQGGQGGRGGFRGNKQGAGYGNRGGYGGKQRGHRGAW